ncbi:MAG: phytanoyl-CoA dioxygenase family protein [Planctomycetales bacterium]
MILDLPTSYAEQFTRDGYGVFPEAVSDETVQKLQAAIDELPESTGLLRNAGRYGIRNLLELSPAVRECARLPEVRRFATAILGEGAFAVRATFFDKVPDANWSLIWHQDLAIAVAEKRDVPGFKAWRNKEGVWLVQPPREILSRVIAVRIHLDDCGPENGPLRVVPGSHRQGVLENQEVTEGTGAEQVTCCVPAGGVVIMSPLTLHASSKAESPSHRRVVHIEYANEELPGGLQWHQRITAV